MASSPEPFLKERSRDVVIRVLEHPDSTHYQVLGVSPGDCSRDTLRLARLVVMKHTHPDHTNNAKANDWSARANAAHAVLESPETRAVYDGGLKATHAPCPACDGRGFHVRQRGFKATLKVVCVGCSGDGWVVKAPRSFQPERRQGRSR